MARPKKSVFVCLIGIDGSGKTSLANMLVESFRREGMDFRYVYGGHQPYLLRPVWFATSRLLLRRYSAFKEYGQYISLKRELKRRHEILTRIYTALHWLDYTAQTVFKISIPLLLGHSLVSDRYVFDTAINIGVNTDGSGQLPLESLRTFFRLLPQPDLLYLIDVDERVALARKSDTPALEYLSERRRLYQEMVRPYSAQIIDGTAPREEQLRQIRQDVLNLMQAA